MKKTLFAVGFMTGLLLAGMAEATLFDRGNGLIYDNVLNITWTQNANLCVTLNDCVNSTTGIMTWANANTWAANLVFQGFSDWRLPNMDVDGNLMVVRCTTNVDCPDNEYGHMFYQNLNGAVGNSKTGSQVSDGGVTLNNIQNHYWSGTEIDANRAWDFVFGNGIQGFASDKGINGISGWAVRPGDSAAVRVPEVGSGLVMGLGFLGMWSARRSWGR